MKSHLGNFVKFVKTNRLEFILLILILLLAAFFRFYRIHDYLIFLGDEGRDVLVVKRMIVDHKWTLLGPTASIASFYLGPIYYYFMLPFLWAFGLNPVGPAVMVALFGVATVLLIYLVSRDFFGLRAGLLAAFLYALSPLVIIQSRSSWNPNLMPFFCLLMIFLIRLSIRRKSFPLLGLTGFLFGITIQFHYLAIFLGVILGVYFLIFSPQRFKFQSYLWSIGGFILGWSPFLLFELRHNFPNLKTIYYFLTSGKETGLVAAKFLPIIKDVFYRLFSDLVISQHPLLTKIILMILPLFFYYWFRERKNREVFKNYSLIFLWLFLGVGLFGFYKNNIYDYYFGFMFPLPFLMVSLIISKIITRNRFGTILGGSLVCWLMVVNLQSSPLKQTPNHQLTQTRRIARLVLERSQGKLYNFALISNRNTDHAYRYFLEVWRQPPIEIDNFENDPERKTVTDQLLVICEDFPCSPLGNPAWQIAGFGLAKIVDKWNEYGVEIYKLDHLEGKVQY